MLYYGGGPTICSSWLFPCCLSPHTWSPFLRRIPSTQPTTCTAISPTHYGMLGLISRVAVRISQLAFTRPRLLGYAGAPIILYTPCFILSIVTAVRILRMHAEIRELRAEEGDRSQSTSVVNNGSRLFTFGRSAASVPDKLRPPTLVGQTGLTVDVRLPSSLTRSSSRPLTLGSITNSSTTHFPIELPTISPMVFPSVYLSRPSPPSPTSNLSFSDVNRGESPSPIVFAHVPGPSSQHHAQIDAAGESCDNGCAPSGFDRKTSLPPDATTSEEPPATPATPSRAPVSLEVVERMPRFHLPTRSPPNGLRPSLELSPEYARARLEADRATFSMCLENLPSSPCSSRRQLLSSLGSGHGTDIIASLPSITYMDRALERLPEVNGADKGSIMKSDDGDFADECKMVSPDSPPLKPVRQFYREQFFTSSLFVAGKMSFEIPQDRPLAPLLVVHQGFIQPSYLWSFSSCALCFLFYISHYKRQSNCSQGFLLYPGPCFVEHSHRFDQGSDHPLSVWNTTPRRSLSCLVSSHCFWFVPIFIMMWDGFLNVSQGIFQVFAIHSYLNSAAALSAHSRQLTMYSFLYAYYTLYFLILEIDV